MRCEAGQYIEHHGSLSNCIWTTALYFEGQIEPQGTVVHVRSRFPYNTEN